MNIPHAFREIPRFSLEFAVKTQNAEKPTLIGNKWIGWSHATNSFAFPCMQRGKKISQFWTHSSATFEVVPSLALRHLDAHHSTAHDQLIGDDYGR